MTITNPLVVERLRQQVASGEFPNTDAVVTEALDALQREKNLRLVRALVAEADEDIARGDVHEITPTFWDELRAEAEEDSRRGLPISDHVKP